MKKAGEGVRSWGEEYSRWETAASAKVLSGECVWYSQTRQGTQRRRASKKLDRKETRSQIPQDLETVLRT